MSLFVSYSWSKGGLHGFGACEMRTKEPRDLVDVRAIAQAIEDDDPKLGGVIILNWRAFPS